MEKYKFYVFFPSFLFFRFFQRCFYYAAGFYHRKLSKGDNMMQEESSKIFAPTTIICIFAQSLTYWI